MDSVYRAADSVYVHPERLMKQMFRDSVYVEKEDRKMKNHPDKSWDCRDGFYDISV